MLQNFKNRFGDKLFKIDERSPRRTYILVDKKDIQALADHLHNELKARFITASGVDTPRGFEILYHFSVDHAGRAITLRVVISKEDPKIDSISKFFKAAEWIEREIHDLLGVHFTGHPNLQRLILPDDWPEGLYPLRKTGEETRE